MTIKTQNEILTDFFNVVKVSPILALNGGIYKKTRPTDSKLEDCIISIINGQNGKFQQTSLLIVKIFYNDIQQGATYLDDSTNGQAKEKLLIDLSATFLKLANYSFFIETRETYIEQVEEIKQHYAVLRMNFTYLN